MTNFIICCGFALVGVFSQLAVGVPAIMMSV
jgi:hypothetical protein